MRLILLKSQLQFLNLKRSCADTYRKKYNTTQEFLQVMIRGSYCKINLKKVIYFESIGRKNKGN